MSTTPADGREQGVSNPEENGHPLNK